MRPAADRVQVCPAGAALAAQQRGVVQRRVLPDHRVGDRLFQASGALPLMGRPRLTSAPIWSIPQ